VTVARAARSALVSDPAGWRFAAGASDDGSATTLPVGPPGDVAVVVR
jgi:hypothetical protein